MVNACTILDRTHILEFPKQIPYLCNLFAIVETDDSAFSQLSTLHDEQYYVYKYL